MLKNKLSKCFTGHVSVKKLDIYLEKVLAETKNSTQVNSSFEMSLPSELSRKHPERSVKKVIVVGVLAFRICTSSWVINY